MTNKSFSDADAVRLQAIIAATDFSPEAGLVFFDEMLKATRGLPFDLVLRGSAMTAFALIADEVEKLPLPDDVTIERGKSEIRLYRMPLAVGIDFDAMRDSNRARGHVKPSEVSHAVN